MADRRWQREITYVVRNETSSSSSTAVDATTPDPTEAMASISFGSRSFSATVTVTNNNLTAASIVLVTPSGVPSGTTGAADDHEWDLISYAAQPSAGSMVITAHAYPGPVTGTRNFYYRIY